MKKQEVIEEIHPFLQSENNPEKYITHVEATKNDNIANCVVSEPGKEIKIKQIEYEPFLFMKDLSLLNKKLYHGESEEVKKHKLQKYGIRIKKLRTDNQEKLINGYCYLVTSSKSLNHILNFFKEGGVDPYEKELDEYGKPLKVNDRYVYKNKDDFFILKPSEQFFISTGIRLFKGIEEYENIRKLIYDIETTGLRYESARIFAIGVYDTHNQPEVLKVKETNDDKSEIELIKNFFKYILKVKPSLIAGYNSEGFDFPFILGRAEKLGLDINKIQTTLKPNISIRREKGILKYGNNMDQVVNTKIWGIPVTDILYAAKRTAAINSDMKNTKLKYVCQFEGIAKPNRTYIEGEDNTIGKMYHENKTFLTDKNNNYIPIPDKYQELARRIYKLQHFYKKGDISSEIYKKAKADELGNNENGKDFIDWYRENANKRNIFISGRVLLKEYLKDDIWETVQVDSLYNQASFFLGKMLPTTYDKICTMGNTTIWELLLTAWSYDKGLAIPHPDTKAGFSGGLARCYKIGYNEDIIKIDYNSLYPMLQLTYDIFPIFDITGIIKKILLYTTTSRNIYKNVGRGDVLTKEEEYLFGRLDNNLFKTYIENNINDKAKNKCKRKELPIKIINNSLFGALGSGKQFKWSDNRCSGRITCSGRLELRRGIVWFNQFGCTPLLAVTDGINFSIPKKTNILVTDDKVEKVSYYDTPTKMWTYGNEVGIHALLVKFNKEEMKGHMGASDDGSAHSCLNLSRINYATLVKKLNDKTQQYEDKIKLTGNTIKSKVIPEYIEEFIDKGLKLILNGDGEGFLKYYHDYVDDIFYQRIPLKKIANKSKIKTTIKNYLNRGTDINGRQKAVQAHMELLIKEREEIGKKIFKEKFNDLVGDENKKDIEDYSIDEIFEYVSDYMPPEPELDSTIYYYNTGYRKSHGDSKMIKDKITGKPRYASKLILNSELRDNPDMLGDYNVEKYLSAFNSRIEKILIGFKPEVRPKILVSVKRTKKTNKMGEKTEHIELQKNMFTKEELELNNFDKDSIEESMYLESKELEFWNNMGYNPRVVWDGFKVNEGDLKYENYLNVLEHLNKLMEEKNKKKIKRIDDETIEVGDYVLVKEKYRYHLGRYFSTGIKIVKYDLDVPKTKEEKKEEELEKSNPTHNQSEMSFNETDESFEKFKLKFNMGGRLGSLSKEELFAVLPEAENAFRLFLEEGKTSHYENEL